MEKLRSYGNAMLFLPTFSYGYNTPVCLRALYTVQDFKEPIVPIFVNPGYLLDLFAFWRSQGVKSPVRLSTGIIMASMALELCSEVHLYGFWPFDFHPYANHTLTHHYYDNKPVKANVHAMPAEFESLLRLHSQGVLRLHLGYC